MSPSQPGKIRSIGTAYQPRCAQEASHDQSRYRACVPVGQLSGSRRYGNGLPPVGRVRSVTSEARRLSPDDDHQFLANSMAIPALRCELVRGRARWRHTKTRQRSRRSDFTNLRFKAHLECVADGVAESCRPTGCDRAWTRGKDQNARLSVGSACGSGSPSVTSVASTTDSETLETAPGSSSRRMAGSGAACRTVLIVSMRAVARSMLAWTNARMSER